MPTSSHPTSSWNRSPAMTRFSIEPVNSDRHAKYQVNRTSPFR